MVHIKSSPLCKIEINRGFNESNKVIIIARIAIIMVLSFIILMLFPKSTTLLDDNIETDYVVFKMMGMAWKQGIIPYRDLFDHKGPVLYLIQMLAFSLSKGKIGLFILIWIVSIIIFELIYRIGLEIKTTPLLNILAIVLSMALFAGYIAGGNQVETWSLPFQLFPLLLAVKFLNNSYHSTKKFALLCGICFGITALIRINNNCIICGIVVGIGLMLTKGKCYRELWTALCCFVVGMIVVILPFVLYFYINDALRDMVYCNLIFNIRYKDAFEASLIRNNILFMLSCIVLPFMSWYYDHRYKTNFFPIMAAMSVISFFVFLKGTGFWYYYQMIIPIAALCIQMCKGLNLIVPCCLSIIFLNPIYLNQSPYPKQTYYLALSRILHPIANQQTPKSVIDKIPTEERNSVYTYGFFMEADALQYGIIPVGKYTFLQNRLCDIDSFVKTDMQKSFIEVKPRWIISSQPKTNMKPIEDFVSAYELIYSDSIERVYLYNRRDTK